MDNKFIYNIAETRIISAKPQSNIIKRTALLNKIDENLHKSLILIYAPAGYGKTTLIQDFIATKRLKFAWVQIHSEMNDFYTFFTYLVYSLKKTNPDFGSITLDLINDYRNRLQFSKNKGRIITDIATAFINEFYKSFTEDLFIVLDKMRFIQNSEWLNPAFKIIFDTIPGNMHFIITSRQVPDINIALLQAKRNICKINAGNLSFTRDEMNELLWQTYGIKCSPKDIEILNMVTGGWITGIHLILQDYGKEFGKNNLEKLIITENIFDYFTEDIFNALSADVKDFLLNTSLLETFSAKQCDEIFSTGNSKKIIDELIRKNVFIRQEPVTAPGSGQVYSYQVLFKSFLENKLSASRSSGEIKRLYSVIADHFNEHKETDNAVKYLILSGRIKEAAEIMKLNFRDYFDSGRFDMLWYWINNTDEKLVLSDPFLLFYKSLMVRLYKGSYDEFVPLIEKALASAQKAGSKELLVRCYLSKFRHLIITGSSGEAIKGIRKILRGELSPENKAKFEYLAAFGYFQNAEYDSSIKSLDSAQKALQESHSGTLKIHVDICNLYGHIYLIRGEFAKSVIYYEQVIKQDAPLTVRFEAYCNLILLYAQSGRFERSKFYIDKVKEITDRISTPNYMLSYLSACQSFCFELGDYHACIKILEEINTLAAQVNHKYYIFLSYSLLGDCYYYLDKLSVSEDYYDLAFKFVNEENEHEKVQYALTKALLLKKSTMDPSLLEVLLEAYNYYSLHKFTYSKTQAALHLADYFAKTGDNENSIKYLKESLDAGESREYNSFLQRELLEMRYLFDLAIANNISKKYIKTLIEDVKVNIISKHVSAEGLERAAELTETLNDIKLVTFGKDEIRARGRLIDDKEWSKKKFKMIFIYLLLTPKMQVSKDVVIDLFFGDTQIESAENIFYQSVSRIRSLVKINDVKFSTGKTGKKNNPVYSILLYEDKSLKINPDSAVYADCLELENIYRSTGRHNDGEAKLQAMKKGVNLYTGEFLEGNYETWIEELRSKYKSYFTGISEELIKMLYRSNDFSEALLYSENLLKYDRYNLEAMEFSIKSYNRLDKLNIAREKLEHFKKEYSKEFGEPLPSSFSEKISRFSA